MRLLLIFFIILLSTSISFSEDRFSNSDGKKNEKSLNEVLKWSWSREEPKKEFIETSEIGCLPYVYAADEMRWNMHLTEF